MNENKRDLSQNLSKQGIEKQSDNVDNNRGEKDREIQKLEKINI